VHFKQQKLDKAREAFVAAWEAKQHYAIAASLAEVEMVFRHYLAAAGYWEFFLKHAPADLAERRREVAEQLALCRQHLAALTIHVDEAGAQLFDNGKLLGESPFEAEVWVEAGVHTFEARREGRASSRESLELVPGARRTLRLSLPRSAGDPVPVASIATDYASQGGFDTRLSVTLVGAGLAVVAAGVGVGFALKANAAGRRADALDAEVRMQGDPDLVAMGSACAPPLGTARPAACEPLREAVREQDSAQQLSTASLFVAGIVGAGALLTYFAWPSAPSSAKAPASRSIAVRAGASPQGVGAWISGAF
jgi:hypothetical protein